MAATTGPHPWAAATPSCPHAERPPRRRRVAPRSGVAVALGRVTRLARAGAAAHVAVTAERLDRLRVCRLVRRGGFRGRWHGDWPCTRRRGRRLRPLGSAALVARLTHRPQV